MRSVLIAILAILNFWISGIVFVLVQYWDNSVDAEVSAGNSGLDSANLY